MGQSRLSKIQNGKFSIPQLVRVSVPFYVHLIMKDISFLILIIAIATTNCSDQYGEQEKRRHVKLNFGIHVPPIVVKLPRLNMPQVTIKANFLKQPHAKPLEVNLPPPPQISFGTPDDSYGGGGGGEYGGGGGYGGGGYDQGNSYGGYGSADTVNVQKAEKQDNGYNGPPPPPPPPYQAPYQGPPQGPPQAPPPPPPYQNEGGYGPPPPPPPYQAGPSPYQEGPPQGPPPYQSEDYRSAYNAAPLPDPNMYGNAPPPQYNKRVGHSPPQHQNQQPINRNSMYEKSAYYNQRA